MRPEYWFYLVFAVVAILHLAPWNWRSWNDELRSKPRKLAMERRLQAFEQEERIRQQAAVIQRTREINAMAYDTCRGMLRAALQAQLEELNRHKA